MEPGLAAPTRDHVNAFWRVLTTAGYADDGAPGPRPQYRPDYYGAFVLDPDGNSVEAVHHEDVHKRRCIDHLWIRVADVAADNNPQVARSRTKSRPALRLATRPTRWS